MIDIYKHNIYYNIPRSTRRRRKYDVKRYLLLHSHPARVQHAPVLGFPRPFWRQRTLDASASPRAHRPRRSARRRGTLLYFRTGRDNNLFLSWRFGGRACDDDTTRRCVCVCVSTALLCSIITLYTIDCNCINFNMHYTALYVSKLPSCAEFCVFLTHCTLNNCHICNVLYFLFQSQYWYLYH